MHSGTLMSRCITKDEETFDQTDRDGYDAKQDSKDTGIIKYKNQLNGNKLIKN